MCYPAIPVLALLLAAGAADPPPAKLVGARVAVQPAAREFARQMHDLASAPASRWIGWAAPAADESRQM